MSAWKLLSQEVTPDEGSFAAIDKLIVTRRALELFGDVEIQLAIGTIATAAIVSKLDRLQVLERGDGQCLYAVDDYGVVTLMLPEDW